MAENSRKLVIVESPAKAKTINKILGKDYKVAASVGHIIDLPKTKLGVDIDKNFEPEYVTIKGKSKVISQLKKEASTVHEVLLATDPDREGEAIAYHIAHAISKSNGNIFRIEFNEITKDAVLKAIQKPRKIDESRVNAQQARRVMDRIVGYQVSPFLWETIYRGLSAGRVQSVALRLLVEREEEITRFLAVEYWTVDAILETEKREKFKARLIKIENRTLDPEKFRISNQEEAQAHRQALLNAAYVISGVEKKLNTKTPSPPFITSTLQQEASRRFRMTTTRVMSIAQQLYEGVNLGTLGNVGLITYMRTDSTRISQDAIQKSRNYITNTYGPDYVPQKPAVYSRKKGSQDAHEAIRPTYIQLDFEPRKIKKFLSAEQFKIYELIWRRFIASQMKAAQIEKTVILIEADKYLFKSEGEVIRFRGYLIAYEEESTDQEDAAEQAPRPENLPKNLSEGQSVTLKDLQVEQKFTQPPPRFTESTLVKTLDKLGIGRPSTYAQIISTLFLRNYAGRLNRAIQPTELGQTVVKLLVNHFPDIFNVKFTARMETNLDKIEQNQASYLDTLKGFYHPFHKSLEQVKSRKKEIKQELVEKTEISCELCGELLVIRWGRNGKFYACSGYPKCKNTRPIEERQQKQSAEKCDKCGSAMVVKKGRFGEFLACSNYPTCKNTRAISTGVQCPEVNCEGTMVQRQSKKGKIFFSCTRYPECRFALWDKPVTQICPNCAYPIMVEKNTQARGYYLQCPACKHKLASEDSQ